MPASPEDMMATMLKNLPEKTGNTLDHWLKVVENSGEEKYNGIIKFLKSEHGLTHGYANLIAFKFRSQDAGSPSAEDWVTSQYSGAKSGLKPLYDILCGIVKEFGDDVDCSPRKTYVTIRRSKQFAIFKASTKDRLDVGLILKGEQETVRLKSGKQFSGMMTHCVEVRAESDIDDALKNWLKQAYEKA